MKLSSVFLWRSTDIISWRRGSCSSLPGVSPLWTTDPALGLRGDVVTNPLSCARPTGAELVPPRSLLSCIPRADQSSPAGQVGRMTPFDSIPSVWVRDHSLPSVWVVVNHSPVPGKLRCARGAHAVHRNSSKINNQQPGIHQFCILGALKLRKKL